MRVITLEEHYTIRAFQDAHADHPWWLQRGPIAERRPHWQQLD
jgi:hypothetical protein